MTRRSFLAAAASAAFAGIPPRTSMGIATTCFMTVRRPRDTYDFLEYCHSLGAGGIQSAITSFDPVYVRKLRERAERHGMYIEAMAGLPKGDDTQTFERAVAAAKEAGALLIRTTAPGPRRYEAFASREAWEKTAATAKAALRRAVPIAEKHRIPLAIENHRDWTLEEFLALLQEYESEYVGACLDTGNNIALLDDPMEVVERLAPYALSTHIKDMGVEEYEDGFLLVEMPFGEGFLDLKRMVSAIAKARPSARMTLEMITRNPTPVACLAEKYWTAMPVRDARILARTLRMVRYNKPREPLPGLDKLDHAARLRVEEDNVKQCLNYARERLGLRD